MPLQPGQAAPSTLTRQTTGMPAPAEETSVHARRQGQVDTRNKGAAQTDQFAGVKAGNPRPHLVSVPTTPPSTPRAAGGAGGFSEAAVDSPVVVNVTPATPNPTPDATKTFVLSKTDPSYVFAGLAVLTEAVVGADGSVTAPPETAYMSAKEKRHVNIRLSQLKNPEDFALCMKHLHDTNLLNSLVLQMADHKDFRDDGAAFDHFIRTMTADLEWTKLNGRDHNHFIASIQNASDAYPDNQYLKNILASAAGHAVELPPPAREEPTSPVPTMATPRATRAFGLSHSTAGLTYRSLLELIEAKIGEDGSVTPPPATAYMTAKEKRHVNVRMSQLKSPASLAECMHHLAQAGCLNSLVVQMADHADERDRGVAFGQFVKNMTGDQTWTKMNARDTTNFLGAVTAAFKTYPGSDYLANILLSFFNSGDNTKLNEVVAKVDLGTMADRLAEATLTDGNGRDILSELLKGKYDYLLPDQKDIVTEYFSTMV